MNMVRGPAKFLADSGILFEVNRRVLHPLGMAISVTYPTTPEEEAEVDASDTTVIRIWDHRKDPEGIYFGDSTFDEGVMKYARTIEAARPRLESRRAALGYVIQGASPDDTARRAYQAYGDSTGWVNFMGKPMPAWEALPAAIQKAWRDATAAVVEP